jgi:hypothetical protein
MDGPKDAEDENDIRNGLGAMTELSAFLRKEGRKRASRLGIRLTHDRLLVYWCALWTDEKALPEPPKPPP